MKTTIEQINKMSREDLEELLDLDNKENNLNNKEYDIIYDRLVELDPETYWNDPHMACHNWPCCDEFGCGESKDGY